MRLPFTADEFLDVFRRYNEAVWPAQWALAAAALVIVALVVRAGPHAWRWAAATLALLWAWTAVAYHFAFFVRLTPAAWVFGAAFLVQAALLAAAAVRPAGVRFGSHRGRSAFAELAGWAIVVYALMIYPMLGYLLGHEYPASPTFGAPCPTTLLTLGVLALALPSVPRRLFVIPVLWSVVATAAALGLGMREDLGLPVAAALAVVAVVRRHRHDAPHDRSHPPQSRRMAPRKMRA